MPGLYMIAVKHIIYRRRLLSMWTRWGQQILFRLEWQAHRSLLYEYSQWPESYLTRMMKARKT